MTIPAAAKHILLAEDDRTSRTLLSAILRKWGYHPIVADNGAQAWEIMQRDDAPGLLLLDWTMPDLDGLEVIQRVRKLETSDSPYIILLSSRGEKASVVQGLNAGANDYIVKPHDPAELRARLQVGQRMLELQAELHAERDARVHEAMHDALTGARNRRALLDALPRELGRAQREHSSVYIGICDIDHFKQVNDTYGHQVGDEVLCALVRLLESNLREYDHLGRWGGEEFLLITPNRLESDAGSLYERLRATSAATPLLTRARQLSITVSIGVAAWNGQESCDSLLAAADAALYAAKHRGRNCICLAEARPTAESTP